MADKAARHKGPVQVERTNAADKRQQSERDAKAWKSEIRHRIVEPTDEIDFFLAEFVHSKKRIPACPDTKFNAVVPTGKGKEHDMYKPLIQGLTSLVQRFPLRIRPQFLNHAHNIMRFPFALCDEEQHVTMPDIIATIPGLPIIPPLHRWRHVALVGQAKSRAADDPMLTTTDTHEETLIQLAKSARNIMLAQGRLYAFVVGIYGHQARIFRFDHAGAVCSPRFDYVKRPDILHEFLWRFLNPTEKDCVVVGDDPTSSLGTHKDRALVQEWASEYDPSYTYTAENRKAVRRFVVTNDQKNKTQYLAYKLISVNPRLFSRATTIWEAFELDEDGEATSKRVIIKEAWRQFVRPSEIGFYRAMQEVVEKAEEGAALSLRGIAEFEYGDDLGLREARDLDDLARLEDPDASYDGADAGVQSEEPNDPDTFPRLRLPYQRVFGHRTVTARCRDAVHEDHERGHMRLVLKSIGTPITEFESTYELIRAMCDAIEGHRQAYVAGIVHRDISKGNVMIARRDGDPSTGFVHDFDYASSWKRFLASEGKPVDLESWIQYARDQYAPMRTRILENMMRMLAAREAEGGNKGKAATVEDPKAQIKQRTGTLHFMSVEVLSGSVTHEARHDLESFYWLLVWIVLRHTAFIHEDEDGAWHGLFVADTIKKCREAKESWLKLDYPPVLIMRNAPLTGLLEDFRQLCRTNFDNAELKTKCMTHEDVLKIFNKALENRDLWPQGDSAKPWTLPKSDRSDPGLNEPSGQSRTKGTMTYSSQAALRNAPDEEQTDTDTDVEDQAGPSRRMVRGLRNQRSAAVQWQRLAQTTSVRIRSALGEE
ncbi:hypothetical protein EVJ58_g5790 [Rhodofomes roseus]|uniref:Fungal-type protein kinase domain-containing protein n=1 Tax=Rhodofomes roseus TaxID=34475 RepID=A0A4Y9YA25_9APHY|nr:hypothetical protein EVJ58_g5790 [Rhodofomes roseus]